MKEYIDMFLDIRPAEFITILLSIVTIVILVFYDCKLKKQQSVLNEYMIKRKQEEELAKKKANLLIMMCNKNIRIQNSGKCRAINIRACLQADNLMFSDADKLSGVTLEEGEFVDINAIFASQIPSDGKLKVQVQWDDDFNKDNIKEKILF